MNLNSAQCLHNAFRSGPKFHAEHTYICEGLPTDDLLMHERLYLVSPSKDWIAKIADSKILRSLAIKTPRTSDLEPLESLDLVQLEISYPSRITSWGFLSQLSRLRRLVIENATTFNDLSYLEGLHEVEFLGVSGGYSKPLKATSLHSLATMEALRAIFLANVRFEDWDLGALRNLKKLELLYTPKWCPSEKVAALRNAIPALSWNWDQN